jgi:hypothetical protein
MLLVGALHPVRALCLFLSQIVGSIAASALVIGIFPAQLNVLTTLSAPTSIVRGVFIEALLTAQLVFTILMLAKEKHRATFMAPVGIGLALFICQLVGVFYTGGSLNPARSFGPCVVTGKWDAKHWIYWVGPTAGALIAVAFYKLIKALEYEMANPGQDSDAWNDPTINPDHPVRVSQREKTTRLLRSLGLDHVWHVHSDAAPAAERDLEKGQAMPSAGAANADPMASPVVGGVKDGLPISDAGKPVGARGHELV